MSRSGRFCRLFAIAGIALLVVAYALYLCGARIDRTASLPKGLYWATGKPPERGDIVTFWPDGSDPFRVARDRGYIIPGVYNTTDGVGYDLLMKRLLGLPGDVVSITDDGVVINGGLVPNTRPLACDNVGDTLPKLHFVDYRLKEDEALFLSDHLPRSFDGRYFGVQRMRQIVEVLVPVVTW